MKPKEAGKIRKSSTAQDIMTRDVITVRDNQDIRSISWTFLRNHITGAPVLDAQGALVGVISQTDLAVYIWGQNEKGEVPPTVLARDLMTRKVMQASSRTPLEKLARTMRHYHIHRMPITRGQKLLGIVTTMDLLKVLG